MFFCAMQCSDIFTPQSNVQPRRTNCHGLHVPANIPRAQFRTLPRPACCYMPAIIPYAFFVKRKVSILYHFAAQLMLCHSPVSSIITHVGNVSPPRAATSLTHAPALSLITTVHCSLFPCFTNRAFDSILPFPPPFPFVHPTSAMLYSLRPPE